MQAINRVNCRTEQKISVSCNPNITIRQQRKPSWTQKYNKNTHTHTQSNVKLFINVNTKRGSVKKLHIGHNANVNLQGGRIKCQQNGVVLET